MKEWLQVEEAAKRLGVHRWHIYRLLGQGAFPNAHKEGGVWLIPAMSIARRKNKMTKRVYTTTE